MSNIVTSHGHLLIKNKEEIDDNSIEYFGNIFDCRQCVNGSEDIRFPCMKCMCQSKFDVIDKSRKKKIRDFDCSFCDDVNEKICLDYSFLENKPVYSISVVDCQNNKVTSGKIVDMNYIQKCSKVNNSSRNIIDDTSSVFTKENYKYGSALILLILFFVIFFTGFNKSDRNI